MKKFTISGFPLNDTGPETGEREIGNGKLLNVTLAPFHGADRNHVL
jgi:hypothetical protein